MRSEHVRGVRQSQRELVVRWRGESERERARESGNARCATNTPQPEVSSWACIAMNSEPDRDPQSTRQPEAKVEPEAKENAEKARRRKLHTKQAQSLEKFSTSGTCVQMPADNSLANRAPHTPAVHALAPNSAAAASCSLSLCLSVSLSLCLSVSLFLFCLSLARSLFFFCLFSLST